MKAAPEVLTVQQIPIGDIVPSLHNSRRSIDPAPLEELAQSIKSVGIQVPLLLRKFEAKFYVSKGNLPDSFVRYGACRNIVGRENLIETFNAGTLEENRAAAEKWVAEKNRSGKFEIVGGERRWRAAQIAGLAAVPAIVRTMTDAEFRDAGLIENLQREDLPPLDEADAYAGLLETLGSVQALAARVGKAIDYVTRRLRLQKLFPFSRQALAERLITIDHALLLAKLAHAEQEDALRWTLNHNVTKRDKTEDLLQHAREELVAPKYGYWEPQSVLKLKSYIERIIDLDLSRAPWDLADAKLVESAGPCTTCPSNTAANAALFGDLAIEHATCTDSACFAAKKQAFVQVQVSAIADAGKDAVRISWKASDAKPRMVDGNVVQDQVFKAGQWVAAKRSECQFACDAVAVDDDSNSFRPDGKKKIGAKLLVCVAAGCKAHEKRWEATPAQRNKSDGRYDPGAEEEKRKAKAEAAAAENKIRLELAKQAVAKVKKLPETALRSILLDQAPAEAIHDLKTAPIASVRFAQTIALMALQRSGLEIGQWQSPDADRKTFLAMLKSLGVDGSKAWDKKPAPKAAKPAPKAPAKKAAKKDGRK